MRNPNVFKTWSQDTDLVLQGALRSDAEYWKLNKFIKDPVEQNTIREII